MNRRRTLTRTRIGGSEPIVVGGQKPWTDLYHFLINASWPALLGFIASLFVGLNLLFALAYYLDRGIERADGFLDVFFFSVETMATIGYGRMSPITTVANILMTVEALTGLIGLAMVTGLVFAKFSIPSSRVRFSKLALIAERDGVPSLLFRMANLRANRIVEATVHIAFARDEITVEGERVRRFYDLPMVRERTPLFALSWTAVHRIDQQSPLYGQTDQTLAAGRADLIVTLTGIDETFAQTVHARHYYDGRRDLRWGGRFVDILTVGEDGVTRIDYTNFDEVIDAAPAAASSRAARA